LGAITVLWFAPLIEQTISDKSVTSRIEGTVELAGRDLLAGYLNCASGAAAMTQCVGKLSGDFLVWTVGAACAAILFGLLSFLPGLRIVLLALSAAATVVAMGSMAIFSFSAISAGSSVSWGAALAAAGLLLTGGNIFLDMTKQRTIA
jgi:hypothetical protein